MDIVEWIPTIITAFATVTVAIATIYYARILKESARRATERPRKEDEINSIITPLISQCNGEKRLLSRKEFWCFSRKDFFLNKIQKNPYKKMIYEDFIEGKHELKKAIEDHEKIIKGIIKRYEVFVNTIDSDDFRKKINDIFIKFNEENPTLRFNQETNSLIKQIITHIAMNSSGDEYYFSDPFKSFWKINKNYFLEKRKHRKSKKLLEEMEYLSNQIIEINDFIVSQLEKILNKYTKEYGLSLEKELIDAY